MRLTVRFQSLSLLGSLVCLALMAGCQSPQPAPARLINHRAMIDFSGLSPVQTFSEVQVQGSVPHSWQRTKLKQTSLYTDMQWRSPSGNTALGIAAINMPLPFSSKVLLYFAQREYAKKNADGRVLNQWVDHLGRQWFEAENTNYRVRGFIVTRGFDGWVIYSGYKTAYPPDGNELSLGARAVETLAPVPPDEPDPTPSQPVPSPSTPEIG
jgi:hypothetical protein